MNEIVKFRDSIYWLRIAIRTSYFYFSCHYHKGYNCHSITVTKF